jgi:hypothetical protein
MSCFDLSPKLFIKPIIITALLVNLVYWVLELLHEEFDGAFSTVLLLHFVMGGASGWATLEGE